jgi:hypothetical protein
VVTNATPKEEPKEMFMGECSSSAEPLLSDDTNYLKRKNFDRPELSGMVRFCEMEHDKKNLT